jgi:hypothetical protein
MRSTRSIWTRPSRAAGSRILAVLLALQFSLFAGLQFWRAQDTHGRGSASYFSSVTSCGNEIADDSGVDGRVDRAPDKRSSCCDFGAFCAMGRVSLALSSLGDTIVGFQNYYYFVYDEKQGFHYASPIWIGSNSPRGPPAYS